MSADVSVVVATRNRAGRLGALLGSLARQEGARIEVVAVDDASRDGTAGVLERAAAALPLRTVRRERSAGPAAARNSGWREASAPLVAFVDDDCVAEPGWAVALAEAHRREPRALVQGRTVPDPGEVHRVSAFARTVEVQDGSVWYETCNIAYPRELLERLGGFDESFPAPAGEDTDLGWRARKAGAPAAFAPGAVVRHAVHVPGALALAREARRWESVPRVVARHPELRAGLHRGLFWHASHERLLAAAAGVVLARRTRGLSLALCLPYALLHRRVHTSPAGTLASLPAHVLVDGAELAALVRGSLKSKTLVL